MVLGSVGAQKTNNPFTGEETTLRARPVYQPLVALRERLASANGTLAEGDRTLLRQVFAYIAVTVVGSLAASAAGEGEMIGSVDLSVTGPDGEPLYEGVYGIIPTPEEIVSGGPQAG